MKNLFFLRARRCGSKTTEKNKRMRSFIFWSEDRNEIC
jgi:hypothetical protein